MHQTNRLIVAALALLPALLSARIGMAQRQFDVADPATVAARMRANRQALATRSDAFAFRDVLPPAGPVPVFARAEVRFQLHATYANPYDPAEIAVDAIITRPDGREARVPAFYHEPFEPTNGLTQMDTGQTYRRAGQAEWRVRFAPDLPGEHRVVLEARDATGRSVRSEPLTFHAVASDRKGFVRVARGNPNYFENSADASLFWGVGSNVAWTRADELGKGARPAPSYELYFGAARGRMTATRVWLCHFAWLEWTPQRDEQGIDWMGYAGAGHYNQMIAGQLDRVFELAEAQGLRIMLVTDDNNELQEPGGTGSWPAHPYNRVHGGPCDGPKEFYRSADARRLYRNRLRYIIARWGYSDCLWAINAWNDMNAAGPDEMDWIRHMHAYVHEQFDGWRPIIYGTNYRLAAAELVDYRISDGAITPGKPNIVQECYYTPIVASFRQELHEQLWRGLARGLAANMVWHHRLVHQTGSWDEFLPLRRFVEDLPLNQGTWRALSIDVVGERQRAAGATPSQRVIAMRDYGDVPRWGARAPRNRFPIDLSPSHQWLEGFARKLYAPRDGRDWRNPPVFTVNLPAPGALLVELGGIGAKSNTFRASVRRTDAEPWSEAIVRRFEGGRRELQGEERWVRLPLESGPRQIMLDAEGDWVDVARVFLTYQAEGPAALAEAQGWTDGSRAFVYVANQSYSRLSAEILQQQPRDADGLSLTVKGLNEGHYLVELYSTDDGALLGTQPADCKDGHLRFSLSRLARDAAVKIRPSGQ